MPHFSATIRTASGNWHFSISITKLKTSPPLPQPKQWKICLTGCTANDGVFSPWNGHSPVKFFPLFFKRTYSPTTRTMSACCFTLSANDPASAMWLLSSCGLRRVFSRSSLIQLICLVENLFLVGTEFVDLVLQHLGERVLRSQHFLRDLGRKIGHFRAKP